MRFAGRLLAVGGGDGDGGRALGLGRDEAGGGDREILAKQLGISSHQLSYLTQSNEGEGLLFYGNVIIPFVDRFPKHLELYRYMTTKPEEVKGDL